METIRAATQNYLDVLRGKMDYTINTKTREEKKDGGSVTKIAWWLAHTVGTGIFVGSFGLLAAPVVAGWSIFSTLLAFCTAQWMSHLFFTLHTRWIAASATLVGLWQAVASSKQEPAVA